MKGIVDAFWRAAAYCLHPKVIGLSLLPLVLVAGATAALGWFFWEPGIDAVRATLERWALLAPLFAWLDAIGFGSFRSVLAPLVVVALALPVIVLASLVLVAALMTPALVRLVAARRFPQLERRRGGSFWQGVRASLGWTLVAVVALAVSVPFWLIPPLGVVLPPLIWGWLTTRVLSFDVLAEHASASERRRLVVQLRWPLLAIGIVTGYLGAAPTLLWALGAMTLVFAPLLIVVSIWLYTLIFAFSALWFAHYLLAALNALRAAATGAGENRGSTTSMALRAPDPPLR
ncbi:EI24 domain-containing protein [Piscinibacter koreensis]|uniref:EI24 domain-containing protein n=1 Tax=Piscinibacter koreensis TaxID=2742824 RepID=A0A7Y6TYK0_9BURK|nr:EI24 domain-containing protein [Schlegelella koreensis]NUZ08166.1 EI24 domain-containing protein [Schlegelella koreensis]